MRFHKIAAVKSSLESRHGESMTEIKFPRHLIYVTIGTVTKKGWGGARPRSGRKPAAERCPCRLMTKARAKSRGHECTAAKTRKRKTNA